MDKTITLNFNPRNGYELQTTDEAIKQLKAIIAEDIQMSFWMLEFQFWFFMNNYDQFDNDLIIRAYMLYGAFNSIMLSVLADETKS